LRKDLPFSNRLIRALFENAVLVDVVVNTAHDRLLETRSGGLCALDRAGDGFVGGLGDSLAARAKEARKLAPRSFASRARGQIQPAGNSNAAVVLVAGDLDAGGTNGACGCEETRPVNETCQE
jgi:hypothetical protein